MANYLASKKNLKVAVFSLSDTSAFDDLYQHYMPSVLPVKKSTHQYFVIHGADYYLQVTSEELPQLLNAGYDVFLLDLGVLRADIMDEFYRCDRKFLLGSPSAWRQKELSTMLSSFPQLMNMGSIFFMIVYGTKRDLMKIAKLHSIPGSRLRALPFLRNPFRIEKEQFPFFEELL